ncbi:retrovirus-related pol polyprotein from transposon TNT 1-94 [Tanacetum coccineum]
MAEFSQIDSGLGRQNSYAAGTSGTRANTSGIGWNYLGQQRVVKCFNCQREGHMARQCPKPKRKRDATWFRDKVLLVEAQGNGKVLNEEELEFLADPRIAEAKAVLMANLSSYGSDVLSEVPQSDNTNNDMLNQSVQEIPYSEQPHLVNKDNLIANESLSAELERYKERVKFLEERQNVDLDINTSMNVNSSAAMNNSVNYMEMCNKCLELKAELIKQHNMVEKDEYNRLSKSFSKLEQHFISLELAMQLNKKNSKE